MSITPRAVLMILAVAGFSQAQDIRTGTLVGLVSDSTGAAVPNAQVVVTNVQTKVATPTRTTSDGNYNVPYLNLGEYEVSVEAPGFKKVVRAGVTIQAGSTMRIEVQLEVGAVNQEIQVSAATPLLATDSAVVGGLDDAKKIEESPMVQSRPQTSCTTSIPNIRGGPAN